MGVKTKIKDAYAAAGVDIDAGNEAVQRMRQYVKQARTPNMLADIGSFGGLFQLPKGYKQPVLVGSTDGVGTKILIAAKQQQFDTIGQDLVNHCVNDILVQGAKPLFFMDYYATAKLNPKVAAEIVKGISIACRENGCALLGGETAEMPGLYQGEDFDLAGTIVGIVEKQAIIDGSAIKPGDVLLGLPSTGLHTNGYSLARHIFFKKKKMTPKTHRVELGGSLGNSLLAIHRSYLPVIAPLMARVKIKGMAHITGGGFTENIPRILPAHCQAVIERGTWPIPPIFKLLVQYGDLDEATMYRTLNMGIGMVLVLSAADATLALHLLQTKREPVYVMGRIKKGSARVEYC